MIARIPRRKTTPSTVLASFDPGVSGALAIYAGAWRVIDLPIMGMGKQVILNGAALASELRAASVTYAVIERVHSWPGGGVAGMFKFGTVFGQILGVVQALNIPYELAEPAKWKREMRLAGEDDKKEQARLRALELFPGLHTDLARKRDHNRAEALLLGQWQLNKQEGM